MKRFKSSMLFGSLENGLRPFVLVFALPLFLVFLATAVSAQTCADTCGNQYEACIPSTPGLGTIDACLAQLDACLDACPSSTTPPPGPLPGNNGGDGDNGNDGGNGNGEGSGGAGGAEPCGDPVDPATGIFTYSHTDLSLNDVLPISLEHVYRQNDSVARAFGIGMSDSYEMTVDLDESGNYSFADLIMPDGGRVHYVNVAGSSSNLNGLVFQSASLPGPFFGSTIEWMGNSQPGPYWLLQLKNGSSMTFGSGSRLDSITDRNGNSIQIQRDANANISLITSPNGRWIRLTTNGNGEVERAQDNTGRTVWYVYTPGGYLSQFYDANGGLTSYKYDSNGRMVSFTTPNGNVHANNQFDSNSRVVQQTQPDGGQFIFNYTLDHNGNVTATDMTDPRQNTCHMTFSGGFLTSDTRAAGRPEQAEISNSRDPNTNLVQSTTDALGRTTTYLYDNLGNVTSITRLSGTPSPVTTSFTYDPTYSQLTSLTNPLNHTWTVALDGNGNVIGITDPLGHSISETRNTFGQIASATNSVGDTIQFGYTNGIISSLTDALGNITTFETDSAGRIIVITDPVKSQTSLGYDLLDRITQTTDANGGVTAFGRDAEGNLITFTDANGGTTVYGYDSMDRRISRTDPLGASESYIYDFNGNVTNYADRRGKLSTYQYDGLNRRIFAGFGKSGDNYESTIGYSWDGGNRLTGTVDSIEGTISRTYDLLDNLTDERTPQGEVAYLYDNVNRRTSMTVAGQTTASYSWDDANRLTGIMQGNDMVSFSYDDANRRTQLTLPNGIMVGYGYDQDSRPAALTWTVAGNPIGDLEYTYDGDGRIIRKTGSLAQTNLPQSVSGNLFNAANEMISFNGAPLSYDANGNLASDGTNVYTWDARNHLSGLNGAVTAGFVYDPFGRRASKNIAGTNTQFVYDRLNTAAELQYGSSTASLLAGLSVDEYFRRADSAGEHDYMSDVLATTLALSDANGNVQTSYIYEPFGNTLVSGASNANSFQFTNRENDGTGLYFYRARYYSPTFQRFLSQDPIEFGGGPNLYEYAADDPIDFRDPSGNQIVTAIVTGAALGFVGGAVYGAVSGVLNSSPCASAGQVAENALEGALKDGLAGALLGGATVATGIGDVAGAGLGIQLGFLQGGWAGGIGSIAASAIGVTEDGLAEGSVVQAAGSGMFGGFTDAAINQAEGGTGSPCGC